MWIGEDVEYSILFCGGVCRMPCKGAFVTGVSRDLSSYIGDLGGKTDVLARETRMQSI